MTTCISACSLGSLDVLKAVLRRVTIPLCPHGSCGGCGTCGSGRNDMPLPTARLYHERSPVACMHAAGQIGAGDSLVLVAELWVTLCGGGSGSHAIKRPRLAERSTVATVNLTVTANMECGRLANLQVTGVEIFGAGKETEIAANRLAVFLEYRMAPQGQPHQ